MSIWDKFDSTLASIYLDYLHEMKHGAVAAPRHHSLVPKNGRLNVLLHYTGDLTAIEAMGFETTSRSKGQASGNIELSNLATLAENPAVVRLAYGREPHTMLDVSVPDINVRGQLWTLTGKTFSGWTGAGVIIGIIDSGIDFNHPFFRKLVKTTRILRIWDQGLINGAPGQDPPPAALLTDPHGKTYGVEYTEKMINDAVQEVSDTVKHRDCNGHGTHVASIAAGDGRDEYQYVGVAPQASLVVVKFSHLDNEPPVNPHQRFKDAVSYILNFAGNKPVVINLSLGDEMAPHDGITEGEDFLTNTFSGTIGKAFVASAGNHAGDFWAGKEREFERKNQHARLEFPAGGGRIDIRMELIDTRTNRSEYNNCKAKDETQKLSIRIYYPFGKTLTVSAQLPDTDTFIDGPALGGGPVSDTFSGRRYTMKHTTESIQRISAGLFQRNSFEFEQTANTAHEHYQGIYTLRITATDEMTAHLYCQQRRGMFRVDDSNPLPGIVHLEDRFLIGTFGGAANILTVASYEAQPDDDERAVADSSSRGPLANYGGPDPPAKPDIAAPGVGITAAMSDFAQRTTCKPNTTKKSGTSMAAPHVTGAAALLLHHTGTLTTAEIINTLKTQLNPTPTPIAEQVGAGRLDVKKALDSLP
jgi:subtilisin family serine protease